MLSTLTKTSQCKKQNQYHIAPPSENQSKIISALMYSVSTPRCLIFSGKSGTVTPKYYRSFKAWLIGIFQCNFEFFNSVQAINACSLSNHYAYLPIGLLKGFVVFGAWVVMTAPE